MATLTVKCKATREMYKKDNFRIVAFEPMQVYKGLKLSKYLSFSCKGDINYITIGKEYTLEIEELETNTYGTSYRIVSVPSMAEQDIENLTTEQAREILLECTTSKRIAENILKVYPDYVKIVLTEGEDAIDVTPIKGVGTAYHKSYCRTLNEKYKYFHIMQDNKDYRIDISDCKELVNKYKNGDGIKKAFADYPYYVLTEILKRGFEQVDKMLMDIRPELKESDQRVESLIIHVLRKNELTGSTRLDASKLFEYINNQMNVPYLIPKLRDVSVSSDYIYYDEKSNDLSVYDTYLAECKIADFVKEKLENSKKLDIDWKKYKKVDDFELTDMQLKELELFCNNNITILSGVSGSGKTSSVKSLVKLMEDNNLSYCLLSPTGSASLRISNQTQRKASTIHRKVLREKEIFSDVIIVDEMSMVGIDVFVMLINAISNKNCRIVLCGDSSQIPAISLGTIFSDMIMSKLIPQVMLTQVFRYNTNGGSFVGENIRQGKSFLDNEVVKENDDIYTIYDNYKFIQCEDDYIFDNVLREYKKLAKTYKLEDIIILSPQNIGECGTRALNQAIENEYNPPKPNEVIMSYKINNDEIVFRVGSRVVNTKNNYKALTLDSWEMIEKSKDMLREEDVPLTELFNGEIGVVRSIDDKKMVCQFDEQLIVFTKANIKNLLLARAISIHRAQGGEWKAVINVISPKHERMLSKNLLYVSDTRGKEYHCDIGDRDTLERALLVDSVANRNTFLGELLVNG